MNGPQDQDRRLVGRALPPLLMPGRLLSQDLVGSICIEYPIHTRRHGLPQSPHLSKKPVYSVPGSGGPCSEIKQSDRAACKQMLPNEDGTTFWRHLHALSMPSWMVPGPIIAHATREVRTILDLRCD